MSLGKFSLLAVFLASATLRSPAALDVRTVARAHWFTVHTAHFDIYSCGQAREVSGLAERLEQFHDDYFLLAGARAVSSPPIVVLAFPDRRDLEPFLPLYEGKPANMDAFFRHGDD